MIRSTGNLKVSTPSALEIALTREFDAPARLVWQAYTTPALLQRWLGVFGGMTLDVCELDLRPGGKYRYVWRRAGKRDMGMGGTFLEVTPYTRLVATERFDESWYEGDAQSTVTFDEQDGRTTLTLLIRYTSQAARDGVLRSPMEHGVATGFDTMEGLLRTLA